ncbi:calcified cuticle protein CP19.0 isoform A [Penaeus vannamei]|uniref:Calcified cuticle protein CP19.0 isoform A n=1 Tax=Penaeus vannamei TaxID=6689 RepID=A0A3R7PIJ5_PENVA|nr:calcified cuticle protein CP19.0 isoform A [Penaeus vannamei]
MLLRCSSGLRSGNNHDASGNDSNAMFVSEGTVAVFLAVLGVCSAGPFTGYTPEVQAERARFFQSFSAAQAAAAPQQAYYHHAAAPQQALYHHAAPVQPKWTGPVAATVPAGVDGTITPVSDTHEVAAARNAFNSAYQAQLRATVAVPQHSFHHAAPVQPKWTGPVAATVPAGLPGSAPQVADTPEVAAAKQQFFSTYNRQAAAAAPPSRHYY